MPRTKIIIDTDVGWDDVMSILLMMKNPDVEIAGITVTGCGETHLSDGVAIARGLLALANNPAPVCAGADTPSRYHHVFPATFRAQMDDVMGLRPQLPEPTTPADPRSADQLMQDILANADSPVTIISLGGLTNITDMVLRCGTKYLDRIGLISIMGGAVNVAGNVADLNNAKPEWNQGPIYSTNTVAEWNIFLDALAAKRAFHCVTPPLPLALVPLDACNNVILSPKYADLIVADDPVAQFLKQVIIKKTGTAAEPDPVPVFDPLATVFGVGLLTDCTVENMALDVLDLDTTVDNTCGQTIKSQDPQIPLKQVVTWASETQFIEIFTKLANAPLPTQT